MTLCLTTNFAMGQSSKSCTYTLFLTKGVEIEHIFSLWAALFFFEIMADFQNCNIWPRNLAIDQNSRSGIYTLFRPQGVKIELIFVLRAAVSEIQAHFQIAIFGHRTWQVAKDPEVAHVPSFYPRGLKLRLFLLYE